MIDRYFFEDTWRYIMKIYKNIIIFIIIFEKHYFFKDNSRIIFKRFFKSSIIVLLLLLLYLKIIEKTIYKEIDIVIWYIIIFLSKRIFSKTFFTYWHKE